MDVRCPRCATDYEFDDALISERGTTVKCTNCGHQFKIFPQSGTGAPERWLVTTRAGEELVYTSLKELQKGIAAGKVALDDLLSRGNHPPRPLRSIAELEGFFRLKADAPKPDSKKISTLYGVAPPNLRFEAQASTTEAARPVSKAPPTQASAVSSKVSAVPAEQPEPFQSVARSLENHPPPTAPRAGSTKPALYSNVESSPASDAPETEETATRPYPDRLPNPNSLPTAAKAADPQGPASRGGSPFSRTLPEGQAPLAGAYADSARSLTTALRELDLARSSREIPGVRPHSASLKWLLAFVGLAVLIFLLLTVGKKYVLPTAEVKTAISDDAHARTRALLDKASLLLNQGELESAKEQIDKGLGISEQDPEALGARAELEAIRADVEWLKLRLIDPQNKAFIDATERDLATRLLKAQAAVEQTAPASQELSAIRARIDVLRMQGKLAAARAEMARLGNNSSTSENAYALVALDLAEAAPDWPNVVQRLRAAALGEGALGRVQAALVYALIRARKPSEASTELERIQTGHPLLAPLKAFVLAAKDAVPAAAVSAAASPRATGATGATHEAASPQSTGGVRGPSTGGVRGPSTGNFQDKLQQARKALALGDAEGADRLYTEVLSTQPSNTEALTGRADAAKRRGDSARAGKLYSQVLDLNPSYLPAMLGSADYHWQTGDRATALTLYRRIVEQGGAASSYGQRAQSRINEAASAPAPQPSSGSPAPSAPSSAPSSAPPSAPNHIDTTDLPGSVP